MNDPNPPSEFDAGKEFRLQSDFVENVLRTGSVGNEAPVISEDSIVLLSKEVQLQGVPLEIDTASNHPANLVGRYHTWKIDNPYPIPGKSIADDYKRRILPMYAKESTQALDGITSQREKIAEVKLAALDRYDDHRLNNKMENLLEQIENVIDEKSQAVAGSNENQPVFYASAENLYFFQLIRERKVEEIEDLLRRGEVNVNALEPSSESSPLLLACSLGLLPIVKALLEGGANPNYFKPGGVGPLHASWDHWLRLPIEHGAKRIRYEVTRDCIFLLLEYGANPNVRLPNGSTPLHSAAHYGHADIVARLLRFGAVVSVRDNRGRTALDVAREHLKNPSPVKLTKDERAARRGATDDHAGCVGLLANWHHVQRSVRTKEFVEDWDRALVAKAEAARSRADPMAKLSLIHKSAAAGGRAGEAALAAARASVVASGGARDATDSERKRAQAEQAALFGSSAPSAKEILEFLDFEENLRLARRVGPGAAAAAVARRANLIAASSNNNNNNNNNSGVLSASALIASRPSAAVWAVSAADLPAPRGDLVQAAEYDPIIDSLREVDLSEDAAAAGNATAAAQLRARGRGPAKHVWAQRAPRPPRARKDEPPSTDEDEEEERELALQKGRGFGPGQGGIVAFKRTISRPYWLRDDEELDAEGNIIKIDKEQLSREERERSSRKKHSKAESLSASTANHRDDLDLLPALLGDLLLKASDNAAPGSTVSRSKAQEKAKMKEKEKEKGMGRVDVIRGSDLKVNAQGEVEAQEEVDMGPGHAASTKALADAKKIHRANWQRKVAAALKQQQGALKEGTHLAVTPNDLKNLGFNGVEESLITALKEADRKVGEAIDGSDVFADSEEEKDSEKKKVDAGILSVQQQRARALAAVAARQKVKKSDGNVLSTRRRAAVAEVTSDAPDLQAVFTTIEQPEMGGTQARRPAANSVLLKGARFRTDTRALVDAETAFSSGSAFRSLLVTDGAMSSILGGSSNNNNANSGKYASYANFGAGESAGVASNNGRMGGFDILGGLLSDGGRESSSNAYGGQVEQDSDSDVSEVALGSVMDDEPLDDRPDVGPHMRSPKVLEAQRRVRMRMPGNDDRNRLSLLERSTLDAGLRPGPAAVAEHAGASAADIAVRSSRLRKNILEAQLRTTEDMKHASMVLHESTMESNSKFNSNANGKVVGGYEKARNIRMGLAVDKHMDPMQAGAGLLRTWPLHAVGPLPPLDTAASKLGAAAGANGTGHYGGYSTLDVLTHAEDSSLKAEKLLSGLFRRRQGGQQDTGILKRAPAVPPTEAFQRGKVPVAGVASVTSLVKAPLETADMRAIPLLSRSAKDTTEFMTTGAGHAEVLKNHLLSNLIKTQDVDNRSSRNSRYGAYAAADDPWKHSDAASSVNFFIKPM